jgi:hypothetical protein
VIRDAVLLNQRDEVTRRVSGESGAGEVGIRGEEGIGRAVEIREIATTAAGDEDLFADAVCAVENEDTAAVLTGSYGSHEPGRSSAEYEDIASLFVMHGWDGVREHAGL